MSWEDILKVSVLKYEAKVMLHDIFNVPLEELDKINIPHNLTQQMFAESNLEAIDEQQFNTLMQLSDEGKYQELLDTLKEMLDIHAKSATLEWQREYGKRPEVKERILEGGRKYRQSPKGKKWAAEYYQRPEVKERRKLHTRESRARKRKQREESE